MQTKFIKAFAVAIVQLQGEAKVLKSLKNFNPNKQVLKRGLDLIKMG